MARAIIYARVSSASQVDHGDGLGTQLDVCRALATERGLDVAGTFTDEGISGTKGLEDRDGLADALNALEPGDLLIVAAVDRLARDIMLSETVLAMVWKVGADVLTPSGIVPRDDPEDPSRALIRQILAAVAAYERALIALRTSRGKRRKAANGGWVGGIAPFGWRADGKGGLERDDDEQVVIADMIERRSIGWTFDGIAGRLNEAKLSNRGKPWTSAAVRRALLSNERLMASEGA